MNRLVVTAIIACIVLIGFTWFLNNVSKKRGTKYWPFVIISMVGIYCIYKSSLAHQGLEDLAYIMLALINFLAAVCSLITALVIDIIKQAKNNNVIITKKAKRKHKR